MTKDARWLRDQFAKMEGLEALALVAVWAAKLNTEDAIAREGGVKSRMTMMRLVDMCTAILFDWPGHRTPEGEELGDQTYFVGLLTRLAEMIAEDFGPDLRDVVTCGQDKPSRAKRKRPSKKPKG